MTIRNGRALSILTLSSGVQSMCEFGPHGIDRHFASEAVGMSNSQEGYYSSLRGLTMILGGKLVSPLLARLGTRRFIDLGNWSCFLCASLCPPCAHVPCSRLPLIRARVGRRQYALKACARGPALMYGSLLPYITGGHTFRIAPIQAMQTRHALGAGMTRGEVAAARSNFEALLKIVAPQLFSRMYTAVRGTPRLQGAPYVLCAALVVSGHGLFGAVGGDADEMRPTKQ
jgi:hypothetical protein